MATHSIILARRPPWTEEPGGLLSMGWQRVSHTEALKQLNTHTHTRACITRQNQETGLHYESLTILFTNYIFPNLLMLVSYIVI